MLISSQFNIFITHNRPNEFILYNTLTGSIFIVNYNAKIAIENNSFEDLYHNIEYLNILIDDGILIDNTAIDELAIFKVKRDQIKYSNNTLSVVILTNYNCNLNCIYCCLRLLWNNKWEHVPNYYMTDNTVEKIIKFIQLEVLEYRYNEVIIDFVGLGEPLLSKRIISDYIKQLGRFMESNNVTLRVNIVTNGTMITDSFLKTLNNENVYFQITIDGPEYIHDGRRRSKNGKGTYKYIINGLEMLIAKNIRFAIRVNVDNDNVIHIDELLEELNSRFGKGLYIKFVPLLPDNKGNNAWSRACYTIEDMSKMRGLWDLASEKGYNVLLRPLINYVSCKAMVDKSYILDPIGDVYKCEGFGGNKEFRIATINNDGLISAYQDAYYKWMALDPLEVEVCRNCELLPACGGECPELSYYYRGKCDLMECTMNKSFIIDNISYQLNNYYLERIRGISSYSKDGA